MIFPFLGLKTKYTCDKASKAESEQGRLPASQGIWCKVCARRLFVCLYDYVCMGLHIK